uniref:Uncharacterized protein n=1 Tax=viral metagenome TaxID=1070528 RepID=A0A6C0ERI5_9ZZZZ
MIKENKQIKKIKNISIKSTIQYKSSYSDFLLDKNESNDDIGCLDILSKHS